MRTTIPVSNGFTILELMTAIAILGVLLAVGVPSFNEMARNNRVATQTNELVGALSLARVEASRRGLPVTVCAANAAQTACDNVTNWANGWLVFTDRVGTPGVVDPPPAAGAPEDELLQTSRRMTQGMQLTTNGVAFIRFNPRGAPLTGNGAVLSLVPQQCSGNQRRTITMSSTGRFVTQKVACT